MKLRDAIVVYRAKNKLSMKAFAEKCGITLQTVYNIETVGQRPSRLTVAKIKLVLGDEYEIAEDEDDE